MRNHLTADALGQLCDQVHALNVEKGFWDKPREIRECLALIISEGSEALEADRKKLHCDINVADLEALDKATFVAHFQASVKDTVNDELADMAIRIMDVIGAVRSDDRRARFKPFRKDYSNFTSDAVAGLVSVRPSKGNENLGCALMVVYDMLSQFYHTYLGGNIAELLDALDLIFGIAEQRNIDLLAHIAAKLRYNATREKRHGKAY